MLTGLWNLKDIQNSRQNRSKNKLVRENALTKRMEVAFSELGAPGKRDHIKIRDYIDRGVTPPKRVSKPTRGPPPPCKQALRKTLKLT